jgi:hypothetical protein
MNKYRATLLLLATPPVIERLDVLGAKLAA